MQTPPSEIRRLLAIAKVIQSPCDLDLLVFLHRHPRTLLTTEQLARLVGYDLRSIGKALDAFLESGMLRRVAQESPHAARLFHLVFDGLPGGGVRTLLKVASTRLGRRKILKALNPVRPSSTTDLGGRGVTYASG